MAWRTTNGGAGRYALVSFDADGAERGDDPDAPGGRFSERVVAELEGDPRTDVFLFSHGWKGDLPAAVDQYDRWIGALAGSASDAARVRAARPGFAPLHIGLHWPSLPFGDEEMRDGASFGPGEGAQGVDELVELYVERLGAGPEVRPLLRTIVTEASRNAARDTLTDAARRAYLELDRRLGLGAEGAAGAPGDDRRPFDPDAAAAHSSEATDFGSSRLGGIFLAPLRQLSFWTMKKRARSVGERGVHGFLKLLQEKAPSARIHLMGHSFGCIVVSSALGGAGAAAPLPRPVDSCVLVQGAMSLWSYAPRIPAANGTPGYFHRLLADRKVRGPVLATISRHDRAVGTLYPIAAGVARQVDFAPGELPKYGAIGAFGLRGLQDAKQLPMLPADQDYDLAPGGVYNLEASRYISKGGGVSGAHSDIDGPEVAHAIWQAALA